MKFEDAKVGMEVVVTGGQADRFPKGAVIVGVDKDDFSVELKGGYGEHWWFWDTNSRDPESPLNTYDMSDIHLKDDGFRKLPPTTHLLAEYLGLDPEKVKCYVDKENGTVTVRQGDKEAKAKKAPQDKWDFRLGMGLALCRLKEKLAEPRKPDFNEECTYVLSPRTVYTTYTGLKSDFIADIILHAMGNTFKTQKEAEDNMKEIFRRTKMIIDFCKKQGW